MARKQLNGREKSMIIVTILLIAVLFSKSLFLTYYSFYAIS